MTQYGEFANGVSALEHTGLARIMCRQADNVVVLLKVTRSLTEALAECNLLIDRHLLRLKSSRLAIVADPARPREIYVERWVGTETQGHWLQVQRGDYLGQVYGRLTQEGKLELVTPRVRFEFFDQVPRPRKDRKTSHEKALVINQVVSIKGPSWELQCSTLQRGAIVECILTGRTKKNGWFAQLADGSAVGPITNSEQMPAKFAIGQQLFLRLNGFNLEKRLASFRWENFECRAERNSVRPKFAGRPNKSLSQD